MSKDTDILIIDDEQVILDSVKKIGQNENYAVDTAIDVQTAFKKLVKTQYKLIICDIMMPDIDGFKFLVEIEKRNITTPVVMTTGFSTVENAVKSLYTGAIGFIPKPFTIDELTSIIHRGIRYGEIISDVQSGESQIGYVSCPAKYYRLGYSSWMNLENDGTVLIGATDLYYKTIDTITEIEFTEVEENITQGIVCIKFHTETELTHHLLSPVSGRVIEKNEKLITDTKLLEKDPYFNGWLYRIIPSDLDFEMKDLIPCSSDRI